jgi:hypothetical protein
MLLVNMKEGTSLTCQNTTWYGIVIKDSQRSWTTTATHLRAETKWIRGIDSKY